jgi:hypothetical protein
MKVRTGIGGTLFGLGQLLGLLWWVAGFVLWFNYGEGIFKLAGLFFIPNLAVPFVAPVNALAWWGWFAVFVGLILAGTAVMPDEVLDR